MMADGSETSWYANGLRFRCTQCGDCCTGEPGFVWLDDHEIDAIAAAVGEAREVFLAVRTKVGSRGRSLREKINGECIYYEKGTGCTIYEVRPRQCRTWPFWESNVSTPAKWKTTCEICPGSGQGELISAEEITQRARTIRL